MGNKDFVFVTKALFVPVPCHPCRLSVTLDSLIYTFIYIPFMDMEKCRFKMFNLRAITNLLHTKYREEIKNKLNSGYRYFNKGKLKSHVLNIGAVI